MATDDTPHLDFAAALGGRLAELDARMDAAAYRFRAGARANDPDATVAALRDQLDVLREKAALLGFT